MKQLELYLHIPFCKRKCSYCDFLSFVSDEKTQEEYVEALIDEIKIKSKDYKQYSVPTIFIGGGTPSVLVGNFIEKIMDAVKANFSVEEDAEITIECNPGTLNWEKVEQYKRCGINRISLGLQSVNEEELQCLGRIHTYADFLESYDMVRKAGFKNVNVDLMSGLPGQSLDSWKESLKKIVALRPEHISAYSLIVEEGTPFFALYGEDEKRREEGEQPQALPTEDVEREMYDWTREYLEKHGYIQYEISNYAKKGKACRHNVGYWKRTNYLGLGLGSASLVENCRFSNTTDISSYIEGNYERENEQQISRQEQMEEFMFLGLRMTKGVSREEFRQTFCIELEGMYGEELQKLYKQGLLQQKEGYVSLTSEGVSVSNYVMAEFIVPESYL